jgi:hypothetical protein
MARWQSIAAPTRNHAQTLRVAPDESLESVSNAVLSGLAKGEDPASSAAGVRGAVGANGTVRVCGLDVGLERASPLRRAGPIPAPL